MVVIIAGDGWLLIVYIDIFLNDHEILIVVIKRLIIIVFYAKCDT